MFYIKRFFSILLFVLLSFNFLLAQDSTSAKLKVFIEGEIPDYDYLRNNLTFIDFVNDPFKSDVHIIVTNKSTGSDGQHYYLSFNSITIKTLDNLLLNCITSYEDTQDEVRFKLSESIKTGLLVFTNEKQLYYQVNVLDDNSDANSKSVYTNSVDPWNNWVFNISLKGGFEAEEQKQNYEYESSLEANRITDKWKIRNEYQFAREETIINKYEDSTKRVIHAFNQEQKIESRITYSLSSHWSTGVSLDGDQTTYRNIRFKASVKPAIEYNFYGWEQVNRRVFTIGYYLGPSYFNYFEPTVLDKASELLWSHSLKVDLEKVEQWGELDVWLEAGHYLPDFQYYALEAGADLSIRVTKGLFIEFGFQAEKINDQLYLPASELSDEDLLLNVRKLPTSFEVSGRIGIRYQFGSMYNNVVNQRL